jgi:hypothetical protein
MNISLKHKYSPKQLVTIAINREGVGWSSSYSSTNPTLTLFFLSPLRS